MKLFYLAGFFFFLLFSFSTAQDQISSFKSIDVLHYNFHLNLSDTSDQIYGIANIRVALKQNASQIHFDLVAPTNSETTGMQVQSVEVDNDLVSFSQSEKTLDIKFNAIQLLGDTIDLRIDYSGIPGDGLVISKSKYGKRTFFGDNWPNRAHHWLPCIDHPSDKATVEFIVECPGNYQVIATGLPVEESNLPKNRKLYHWKSAIQLPTKVMVIGVAEFAVQQVGSVQNIPISTWVYPENRSEGFYDYAIADRILEFFIHTIGPYPFEKLANVQSKTRWGGMENAGNIFYFENSVTGKRAHENLFAHEIAHQWFGDSASELEWHHVWLSEGFATYFTDLFVEAYYGEVEFQKKLQEERVAVVKYAMSNRSPIVDPSIKDINRVLSTNTYQKAAWVLHMLRNEIGDANFWEVIQKYYQTYKFSNALTDDFRLICEEVSNRNLQWFFNQWLFEPGHPKLKLDWKQDLEGLCTIRISQNQAEQTFRFPLEIQIQREMLPPIIKKIDIFSAHEEIQFQLKGKLTNVLIDPDTKLLFEKVE